ncbi:MAG: hypothetical protein VXW34_00230 [Actinomycetota bacterium]|nr:hypothetical protein [Actinomycetota bacterium]
MKTRLILAAVATIFAASIAVSAPTFANFISGGASQSVEPAFADATFVVEEVRFRGAAAPATTAPEAPTTTIAAAPATTAPEAPTTTVAAAPTTTVAAAPPSPSCVEAAIAVATSLLAPHGIPVPGFTHDPSAGPRAYYTVGGGITIRECVSDSVVAHELGHYIHFLSVGSSWSAMKADSLNFCLGQDAETGRCEGGWLSSNGKKSEAKAAPGVEHAAHCIGNQLGVSGSYSKCPDSGLISLAQARIASA